MKPRTLDDFGADSRPHGAQLLFRCPSCQSRRHVALVDPASGLWHCARCNDGGRVRVPAGPDGVRQMLAPKETGRVEWGPAAMPPHTELSQVAVNVMFERYGISREMAKRFYLVEGEEGLPYAGRILIPYCGQNGEILYFSGRSYTGEEPKYLNMPGRHPLYLPGWLEGDQFIRSQDILLVEGAFDAMKAHLAVGDRMDVVAIGGKALARYLLPDLLKLRPDGITIALDSDALGASLKLRAQIAPYADGVRIVTLPDGQDPGSMGIAELREILTNPWGPK